MFFAIHHIKRNLCILHFFFGIEHAQFHSCQQQPLYRRIDLFFGDQSFIDGFDQMRIIGIAAIQIRTGLHCFGCRLFGRIHYMMGIFAVKIADGTTVRNDVTFQSPFVAQQIFQILVSATGLPPETLIGTHHGIDICFTDTAPEMRKIGLGQIVIVRINIERMPHGFRPAVNGKMFRRSHQLQVFRIVTLQPFNKRDSHLGR